jgi:prepilin-type N-terminal cleavage/methylation domain-containing protein
MSQSARPRLRRGFSLVELLVVIMIIAMLMGMTSFAVWKVILNAKQARIATEIDQLSQAMAGYKQARIQYPPCMGTADIANRKMEFLRHIALAFTNANYGSTATDFDALRLKIYTAYNGTNWGYNYRDANGAMAQLDLHTLDQAEALVFWLGGFPTPVTSTGTVANRRLFGFHRDEDNPFRRSVQFENPTPMQFRTDPMFNFQEERLTDIDGDGWLEYAPLPQRSGEPSAPYVYFDSYTYGISTNVGSGGWKHLCYPRANNSGAGTASVVSDKAKEIAATFGLIGPMASMIDGSRQQATRWANATGIQIACGGLDGRYGASVSGELMPAQRCVTSPKGESYGIGDNFGTAGGLSREELDNQTNLSSLTVDGARSESSK